MQLTTAIRPGASTPQQVLRGVPYYDLMNMDTYEELVGTASEILRRIYDDTPTLPTDPRLDYVASETSPCLVEVRLWGYQLPTLDYLIQTKGYRTTYLGQHASVTRVKDEGLTGAFRILPEGRLVKANLSPTEAGGRWTTFITQYEWPVV